MHSDYENGHHVNIGSPLPPPPSKNEVLVPTQISIQELVYVYWVHMATACIPNTLSSLI